MEKQIDLWPVRGSSFCRQTAFLMLYILPLKTSAVPVSKCITSTKEAYLPVRKGFSLPNQDGYSVKLYRPERDPKPTDFKPNFLLVPSSLPRTIAWTGTLLKRLQTG